MSLEEVTVNAGHKVFMEVDYTLLIAGDPKGILGQWLKPHTVHSLHIINLSFEFFNFI